ncbi:MAG: F0F1 ATP synthase subunit B [Bacteroidaceae bacterium]|nr:F0F1 ATP synthase subunit B [Bacteroidaceae bacterium]
MELFKPEFGLIFWMFFVFVVMFVILAKYAWPVIIKNLDERAEFIDKGVEYSRDAKKELDNAAANAQLILAEAQKQQLETLQEASVLKNKIIEEAKHAAAIEAQKVIDAAAVSIEQSRREAEMQLRKQVSALSLEIVERLMRKDLSNNKAQIELIDKLLDEMEIKN